MQMDQHGFKEDKSILPRDFDEKFRDASAEVMLVDHLIEVPQSEEERFDDVGEEGVFDVGRTQQALQAEQYVLHGGRHCVIHHLPI